MAYLFYTYCDQNSSTLLPYIKETYQGNLSLQQQAYSSGKNGQYKKIMNDNRLTYHGTSSSNTNSNGKSFEHDKKSVKIKKYDPHRHNSTSM